MIMNRADEAREIDQISPHSEELRELNNWRFAGKAVICTP
jgi:hypothetical protein